MIRKFQNGFTLVELAIVLMIIGLLIGGILRGQELMNNARITSLIQQIKAYDAAMTTFRDQYNSSPGDIPNPGARIPNCGTPPCNIGGNGDNLISPTAVTVIPGRGGDGIAIQIAFGEPERNNFWLHLEKAHLISGIDPTISRTVATDWGQVLPASPFSGSGFVAASGVFTSPPLSGNFYALISGTMATGALKAPLAAQFDRKIDDGSPNTGDVFVFGDGASATTPCISGAGSSATYTTSSDAGSCDFVIRMAN